MYITTTTKCRKKFSKKVNKHLIKNLKNSNNTLKRLRDN